MKKSVLIPFILVLTFTLVAKDKNSDKKADKVVDAGAFGIYLSGKRIGTETFHIEQRPDMSVATSQIKVDDGSVKAEQSSEMQLLPSGNLRSYSWRSTSPEKAESVVEPKDELLVEHISAGALKQEMPYVLPASTVILDDNFFSQREILVWRYLATGCLPKDQQLMCSTGYFGILVPHQHASSSATMQLLGRDKITYKGSEHELNKFKLECDGVQWFLWVDDQYKVLKMAVPANNVEVIRD